MNSLIFKKGMKMRIRPDLKATEDGGDYKVYVNKKMLSYAGKKVIITEAWNSTEKSEMYIDEDEGRYVWTDDLLLPPYETQDELFEALVKNEINESTYTELLRTLSI